jgi:hypothetical protein
MKIKIKIKIREKIKKHTIISKIGNRDLISIRPMDKVKYHVVKVSRDGNTSIKMGVFTVKKILHVSFNPRDWIFQGEYLSVHGSDIISYW